MGRETRRGWLDGALAERWGEVYVHQEGCESMYGMGKECCTAHLGSQQGGVGEAEVVPAGNKCVQGCVTKCTEGAYWVITKCTTRFVIDL